MIPTAITCTIIIQIEMTDYAYKFHNYEYIYPALFSFWYCRRLGSRLYLLLKFIICLLTVFAYYRKLKDMRSVIYY